MYKVYTYIHTHKCTHTQTRTHTHACIQDHFAALLRVDDMATARTSGKKTQDTVLPSAGM